MRICLCVIVYSKLASFVCVFAQTWEIFISLFLVGGAGLGLGRRAVGLLQCEKILPAK